MTPFVDIISAVVDAMKVTLTSYVTGNGATKYYFHVPRSIADKLFTSWRAKLTIAGVVYYGKITEIKEDKDGNFDITVTLESIPTGSLESAVMVINYHHGHLLEVKNTFKEYTTISAVKREQFPAIVLVQDFPEQIEDQTGEREVTCTLFIVTDSQQKYTAADRYTNTLKPILYPLYDRFLEQLDNSDYVADTEFKHTKIDRVFWGRDGGEGSLSNIFNDFIDAIEISNLKVKILKTC